MTQAAIANVETQTSHRSQPLIVNLPLIRGCAVIRVQVIHANQGQIPASRRSRAEFLLRRKRRPFCHAGSLRRSTITFIIVKRVRAPARRRA
jgi:hypothetical protein